MEMIYGLHSVISMHCLRWIYIIYVLSRVTQFYKYAFVMIKQLFIAGACLLRNFIKLVGLNKVRSLC